MKRYCTVTASALLTFAFATALFAQAQASEKPNFVIILADDSSYHDYGCWGNADVKTPNIDTLAKEGMKLTRFYSPAAVCSPLRQALLTGMYPVRNGAYPNHSRVYPDVKSLPNYLAPLGYKTICVGKQHFNPVENYPFDETIGMIGEDGLGRRRANAETNLERLERFVTESPEKPFCLYIASNEPHHPWTKGDASRYDPDELKLPPYFVDTPQTRQGLARYYAEITHLDGQVGMVLNLLEKTGHVDDTIVFFFSEQGSNFLHCKWTLYDTGVRVAAIARWPGRIAPSSENAALVQYIDVLPTLVELAGGDPNVCDTGKPDATGHKGFDGKSLKGVLLGKTTKLHDYAFAQHTSRGIINGPEAYATRMVTDGRWKLIRNIHHDKMFRNVVMNMAFYQSWLKKAEEGDAFAKEQTERYVNRPEWELYDMQSDPFEMKNVAGDPANAEVKAKLEKELRDWMARQGDEGHETEIQALDRQPKGDANRATPEERR